MNNLWNKILVGIIILMILALISNEYFATKDKLRLNEKITDLVQSSAALKSKYDSLLYSKQKITIQYDTITDTVYIPKLIPYKTDSLPFTDSLKKERNFYRGTVQDTNIKINYKAQTLGILENLELSYTFVKKNTTIENILYVDKPVKIEVWTPKRHLYLYGDIGAKFHTYSKSDVSENFNMPNEFYYGVGLLYLTKQNHAFKTGYHKIGKGNIYSVGMGLKVF